MKIKTMMNYKNVEIWYQSVRMQIYRIFWKARLFDTLLRLLSIRIVSPSLKWFVLLSVNAFSASLQRDLLWKFYTSFRDFWTDYVMMYARVWSVFLIIAQYLIHKNHTLSPFYIDKKQFKTVKTIKNIIRRMSFKFNHFNEHKKSHFYDEMHLITKSKCFLKKFDVRFFSEF